MTKPVGSKEKKELTGIGVDRMKLRAGLIKVSDVDSLG